MADFFIKRPILSICLSVIIVLLGAFSILRLPISEYPDIIPPSIQVTATYPGADCETVVKSIASPIEQQMSGVDGMSYMTSVNTNNGQMSMMILFDIGTEADETGRYARGLSYHFVFNTVAYRYGIYRFCRISMHPYGRWNYSLHWSSNAWTSYR